MTTTKRQTLVDLEPSFQQWSGTAKIHRANDLPQAAKQMPSTELLDDGVLKLINPDTLRPFRALRKRMERLALDVGFRRKDGVYTMTENYAEDLQQKFEELLKDFVLARDAFINDLPQHYADWESDPNNAQWAHLLVSNRPAPAKVTSRFRFSWEWGSLYAHVGDQHSPLRKNSGHKVQNAVPALLETLANEAQAIWKAIGNKTDNVNQNSLRPFRAAIAKLADYSFMDSRVAPISDAWLDLTSSLPKTGVLDAGETALVQGIVQTLLDPEQVLEQGEMLAQVQASAPTALLAAKTTFTPAGAQMRLH